MSSTDDASPSTDLVVVVDDPLADLLEEVREALGDAIVDVLLKPGDDLWVRVRRHRKTGSSRSDGWKSRSSKTTPIFPIAGASC